MRIMLINPPYQTLTSNLGVGHQTPLGLLMIGGALLEAGHAVELLDAEALHHSNAEIAEHIARRQPDVVMTGHAGSTPAHPVCMSMLEAIKRALPGVISIYGGVFPTYHSRNILRRHSSVDVIVRGEGEATIVDVASALDGAGGIGADALHAVNGITFRDGDEIVRTPSRTAIRDLDSYRVGWELIDDWDLYQCFGLGRAAIVQLSRGCPHRCTYCGQHGFWNKWRHRHPESLAEEIVWLHDAHGVRFVTLADENPTTSPRIWQRFLEAMAARNENRQRDIRFFATIRASDIVRDREMMDLYRRAGILYVLLGIDTTSPQVIEQVRKRSTTTQDHEACSLLRRHGMRPIIAQIVGLGGESWSSMRQTMRALRTYDGDLLNVMYATPHTWTPFAQQCADRSIVQEDQRLWDYRHQVLGERRMRPWQLFVAVKWMEFVFHMRPSRLLRLLWERDGAMRRQLWWTALHVGAVWLGEVVEFLHSVRFTRRSKKLRERLAAVDSAHQPDASRASVVNVTLNGQLAAPKNCRANAHQAELVTPRG